MSADQWRCTELGPRLHLYQTDGDKFKTTTVRVYLHVPLSEPTVTVTALVPSLLGRGCRGYPDLGAIHRHLEELYGASVGAGVTKCGEVQSVYLALDAVMDQYLPRDAGVLEAAVELLRRMAMEPALEAGVFPARVVAQEKENLARRIRSRENDKGRYAAISCLQNMCANEPYALLATGRLGDLCGIGPHELTDRWRQVLATAKVDVFAVGGGPGLADQLERAFLPLRLGEADRPGTTPGPIPQTVRTVTEKQAVSQGKLVLGYRTSVTGSDARCPAMLVYNGVLGGFPHSKLFRNVRERASLAYYASSSWDALKGILLVSAGIANDRREQAVEIIGEQVRDIAAGRITADEMEFTKAAFADELRAEADDPYALIEAAVGQVFLRGIRSIAEREAELSAVTPDQVAEVGAMVHLDTVFFLEGDDAGEDQATGGGDSRWRTGSR